MTREKRYPELIAHLPRSLQILIFIFVNRLDSGKNCMVIIVGGTGSGKSLASVSLLYWIHIYMHGKLPDLEEMKTHWFFKSKDFLVKMNDDSLKKKECHLWDEMGVSASHKTHQSIQNRVVGWLAQTFRNLQQLVIFTVPTVNFIDASVRKLLHYQLETRNILRSEGVCIIKPLEIQYNVRMDKVFYHNLAYPSNDGSGFLEEVDVVGIPRPPKDFEAAYEEIAGAFKKQLNLSLQAMLEKEEFKEKKDNLVGEERLLDKSTDRQRAIWALLKEGVTSTNKIAEILDWDASGVSHNFNYMRNRGLNVDKFLEKNGFEGVGNKTTTETIQVVKSDG